MKALQKQIIKLPNLGKYIKKNDMKWLIFLILPLFLGLIIHFLIPISFILNSNPVAQSSYNHEKITLQQQTVRSLSILNAEIIRMKLQRYENIRNFLIRIFGEPNAYQQIIPTEIFLNNAYDIANTVQNGGNITQIKDQSMWYAQGVSIFDQLNQVQQFVYLQYLAVQPFIRTQFLNINNSTQQSILKGLTLSANYLNQPLYFAYPSQFMPDFLSLQTSAFDKYYNKTMYNYQNSNGSFQYCMYSQVINGQNQLVICNIIFSVGLPAGVACFYIQLNDIAQQLTNNLAIPNITYSTTSYYLLTPIYPSFVLQLMRQQPQIIFNFTDKNSQLINYPIDTFYQLPQSINKQLFIPNPGQQSQNYSFYVTFDSGRQIYFQVPINIYSYEGKQQTILFLLIKYNFQGSVFNSIAKFSSILKDLSIPSSIVIFVSTIISLIILKCLLNSLDGQLHKVNDKCQFMVHGDLDLKISDYTNTQQLQSVYKHLQIVNHLHKFSTQQYFVNQSPQKQLIKLFKVIEIFNQLQYPTDIVLENIADCYLMIGELFKTIQFLQKSYQMLCKQVEKVFGQSLQQVLKSKHDYTHAKDNNKKLSKKYRRFQLKLIAKLFKLILMYSFLLIPPPEVTFNQRKYTSQATQSQLPAKLFQINEKKMRKYLKTFKKLAYPNCVTSETVFAYLFQARFQIQKKNFKAAKTILKRFQRIMAQYGTDFENFESNNPSTKDDSPVKTYQQMKNNLSSYCKVSPTILWSAYYFIHGLYLSQQPIQSHDIPEIVQMFKKSTQGNTFSQDIHLRVLWQMIKLSYQYKLQQSVIKELFSSFVFFKQIYPLYHIKSYSSSQKQRLVINSKIKSGIQKQVVFLFDCSNKWIFRLQQFRKWQKQCRQISLKIFGHLQLQDRVSILKVNSSVYVSTCCNLIYKKGNESLITKQLSNAIKLKFMSGRCKVIQAMKVAVNRVKQLDQQKYIIIFVKQNNINKQNILLTPRGNETERKKEKKMSESSSMMFGKMKSHNFNNDTKIMRKNTEVSPHRKQQQSPTRLKADSNFNSLQGADDDFDQLPGNNQFYQYYKNISQEILQILLNPQISNLKLILITNNAQSFNRKFNLSNINATLQKEFAKRHRYNNNALYVLEYSCQEDFQRIFKVKTVQRDTQNILPMF